jgi:hypothetical protein
MATGSSTVSSTLNGHGLIVVPRCANPAWVADHGSLTGEYELLFYLVQQKADL